MATLRRRSNSKLSERSFSSGGCTTNTDVLLSSWTSAREVTEILTTSNQSTVNLFSRAQKAPLWTIDLRAQVLQTGINAIFHANDSIRILNTAVDKILCEAGGVVGQLPHPQHNRTKALHRDGTECGLPQCPHLKHVRVSVRNLQQVQAGHPQCETCRYSKGMEQQAVNAVGLDSPPAFVRCLSSGADNVKVASIRLCAGSSGCTQPTQHCQTRPDRENEDVPRTCVAAGMALTAGTKGATPSRMPTMAAPTTRASVSKEHRRATSFPLP